MDTTKDKSTREYGNYTIVKTKDGDVVLVGKEGAITEEYKTKKSIKRLLNNRILPIVDKIIEEGVEDIYKNLQQTQGERNKWTKNN